MGIYKMMISSALKSKFTTYRFFAALSSGLSATLLFTLAITLDISNVGRASFNENPGGIMMLGILAFSVFMGMLFQLAAVIALVKDNMMDYLGTKQIDAMKLSQARMLSYGLPALVGFTLMQITPLPSQTFKEQGVYIFIIMLLVVMAFVRYCAYKLVFQLPIDYQKEIKDQ
jgi:hypothetical protein